METCAVSSSVMMTVSEFADVSMLMSESPDVIPAIVTVTSSLFSSRSLSMTETSIVADVCPAAIVNVVGIVV